MAIVVRKMTVEDLLDAKGVDLLCWNDLMERSYGLQKKLYSRTDENILSFIHSDPEGCFVAADDYAGVIGTSFSHVWGTTGWVGPLSVLPSHQAKGVGKELLEKSLRYLEDQGCLDIGLETMPENTTNLGMYLKAGLRTEGLVLVLGRKIEPETLEEEPSGSVSIERLSESLVQNEISSEVRRISSLFRTGLDYSKEVELVQEFVFGDTLIATSRGKVVGFAIVQTAARRINMPMTSVKVLAADPSCREDMLEPLLFSAELLAADARTPEIHVAIPIQCRRPIDVVLSRGYTIIQSFERFMWMGSSGIDEKKCNLCSWTA